MWIEMLHYERCSLRADDQTLLNASDNPILDSARSGVLQYTFHKVHKSP